MTRERHNQADGEHVLVHCDKCRTTAWLFPQAIKEAGRSVAAAMIKRGWSVCDGDVCPHCRKETPPPKP